MSKYLLLFTALLFAGCGTLKEREYKPYGSREKKAYKRADYSVSVSDVQTNFQAYVSAEVAWAGIIEDIQFKEMERTIQVAFSMEQRDFDWKKHRNGKPYHLGAEGQGQIKVGWTVDKPARISHLKTLAKPGYMLVVYGKPYRKQDDVIQLAATAVRPIKDSKFQIEIPISGNVAEEVDP